MLHVNVSISQNMGREGGAGTVIGRLQNWYLCLSLKAEALHTHLCSSIGFLFYGKAWMKVSGGLFCRQWLMSVAHCFPSWNFKKKEEEESLTNLCLKFSEQGMSSAISLYFFFYLMFLPFARMITEITSMVVMRQI